MLDVSRHFLPKEFIYDFIDHLAMHKLNTFHWHLVDDQGWRIEIKKYPKLTDIGAWRVDREDLHWNAREDRKPDEKATYGGFYTQKEIRDIVAYAQSRYVTIVPEIEMPGHTTAALAAYPQYSCTGGPFTVLPGGVWPITDIFCAGKDETFDFLEDILTEVLDLFPGQYIHIGGDEADKKEWKACELCQARIKTEGLKDEDELQSYFIRRIEKFIISKGRRLIGWDEILEGGLAPQAAVMSWRGTGGGIEAARQNHDVVMSPTSHCYFDYYQGNPDDEPLAIGGFLPLRLVYSFEPVPADLSPEEAEHILGAQANLWTEYVPTPEHAEYMLFPRTAALAEVVWSTKGENIWDDFATRMERQFSRYDAAGIHYARSAFNVKVKSTIIKEEKRLAVRLETELPQPVIRYTLNGKKPNSKSTLYTDLISIDKTTMLKAGSFTGKKLVSPIREEKFTIHKATAKNVTIKYAYAEQYSGGGDHALIDSLRGSKNHKDGFWQGYKKKDLEAIIDLGKVIKIKRITSSFLHNIGARIFLPTDVEYSVSENGENYEAVVSLKNDVSPRISDRIIKEFSGKIKNVKTRYVKVHAKNIGLCPEWHFSPGEMAWLFIDEIIIE
jgi:hexosaminidase